MFIKSLLICMFIPSIIIDANYSRIFMGNPITAAVTRGGKFFGLFPVPKRPIFPYFHTKNKNWRGAFIFSLGGYPLIATSVEYNHAHVRDPLCIFCLQHPQEINTLVNQFAHQQPENLANDVITNVNDVNSQISAQVQYDPLNNPAELPLNITSILASATATLSTKPTTTTSSTQDTLRTLKLEDYYVVTVDPNDSSEDDALNRVRREIQDEIESTTIESSAQETTLLMSMTTMRQEELLSDNHSTSTISPMLELPQKPSQDFHLGLNGYPESKHPNAEYISITQEPQNFYGFLPQIQSPVKNYYNFYPSQPDYSYYYRYNNFIPYCYATYGQGRFIPSSFYGGMVNGPRL